MNERELERRLEAARAPDEDASASRAWPAVAAAYAGREHIAGAARRRWPVAAIAAALALVAAALTPQGRAVFGEMRERIGVEGSRPALFSLPAPGRLLVESAAGLWVVERDGSRRLLAGYREGSWSPFGLYVVATRANELSALERDGDARWTLPRRAVRLARWGGTRTDTRIAYLSGDALRVVAGDGTDDRLLSRRLAVVAPAWRPRSARHVLAFALADGRIRVVDADARRTLWSARPRERVVALEWSADGRQLLARTARRVSVYAPGARRRFDPLRPPAGGVVAARLAPAGATSAAIVRRLAGRSELVIVRADGSLRRVFSGAGAFTDVAWSPDRLWLVIAWQDADQWVFVRSTPPHRIDAVGNISGQFGGSFPRLSGWCCP